MIDKLGERNPVGHEEVCRVGDQMQLLAHAGHACREPRPASGACSRNPGEEQFRQEGQEAVGADDMRAIVGNNEKGGQPIALATQ